jgi:hypothetical protein
MLFAYERPLCADFVAEVGCNCWMSFAHFAKATGLDWPALTLSTRLL